MNTGYARVLFPFSTTAVIACGSLPTQTQGSSLTAICPVRKGTLPVYNVAATNAIRTGIVEILIEPFNKETENRV